MPTNDFLEYAADPGANVEPQADYVADIKRIEGQQTGIANSANANKAWRQATAIISALAQLVVDTLAVDMLDNGDQADKITKLGNLITGLSWASPTFTGAVDGDAATSFLVPTVAGTTENSTKAASTGFVQAVRALLAPLASPTFTGVPAAPTAAPGTNTTQIATTAFVHAAEATKPNLFKATGIAITTSGSGTVAHGLGGVPDLVKAQLVCVTPEAGIAAGEIVDICVLADSANMGVTVHADGTNVYYHFGSGSGGAVFELVNTSTSGTVHLTNADWNLQIIALKV